MGIENVEELHGHSEPRPDDEVIEEVRREEEGIEPTPATPAPDTSPPEERDPTQVPSPPNPGGGNAEPESEPESEPVSEPEDVE